ncbi:hypothetical protein M409DRAFT_54258 [Zasmidium cellare ATCC 36951]|uniref:Heterokaryon incompatibility domain-containing protein n=1 Tax=Zasmidium cellare ATCC 36951 TaxID=1080233 RepID=A0A6A6CIK1_ZASCE|nr:uncharacterized protein M409DRAFT_54258 [Zasmidium cellare ATCC 36951]KAF2167044.1 hypothetical protein M409DRAFT_54258 [Zasmidium cellare ATCC 36951]
MASKLIDSWWFGDRPRDIPFWLRDTYPVLRDPSGIEVVSSMEELTDHHQKNDRPGDSAIWAFQIEQYIARKSGLSQPSPKAVTVASADAYRPTMRNEARVFELLPAVSQEELRGRLHYVNLDFEHGSLDLDLVEFVGGDPKFRPTSGVYRPQIGRRADFGVSMQLLKKISYTAVSYVWGSGEFLHVVKLPSHDLAVTATVDTILKRLRGETSSVFLWIDQICIDQRSLDDKTAQVQLMGTIYKKARNTVAWLGDEPDNGALRALQGLYEATMGRDEDLLEDELEYLRHPLNEEADTFESLLKLSNRAWFQRTWIVQEAILSHSLFLMIGSETVLWDDFGGQCASVDHLDLFEDSNAHVGSGVRAIRNPGLKIAAEMRPARDMCFGLNGSESLLNWLMRTSSIRSQQPLLRKFKLRLRGHDLTRILDAVDHDPELSHLPSWVVDWSLPRRTISLAPTSSVLSIYKAGGDLNIKTAFHTPDEQGRLGLRVAFFDTIVDLSSPVTDASLTNQDPMNHNTGLKEAILFVNEQDTSHVNNFFDIFCTTLVAGKDRSGMQKLPKEYIEILSLLCDETTGRKPSLPQQIYTPRQSKGYFTLSSLSKRQPGRTFQNLKRAFRNAMLNRRLCWTSRSHLGLVPRFARGGDEVWVVPGLAVPFVVRRRGEGRFVLIGVAYVCLYDRDTVPAKASTRAAHNVKQIGTLASGDSFNPGDALHALSAEVNSFGDKHRIGKASPIPGTCPPSKFTEQFHTICCSMIYQMVLQRSRSWHVRRCIDFQKTWIGISATFGERCGSTHYGS